MKDYELTVVFSPEVLEENFAGEVEKVTQLIVQKGGTITGEVNRWGKKRLAYPIKRFREGNYVLAQFKVDPQQTRDIERSLQTSEVVLRHLLVKL